MVKAIHWGQRSIQIGTTFALIAVGSAHNTAAAELWRNDQWIVSTTDPTSEEEIAACILQPSFSVSEFKFVWDPSLPFASIRLDLSFNPMDAAEYERNEHILVQFDQSRPISLKGSIDGGEIYYDGSIQEPGAFFMAAARASAITLGTEEMGFVVHNMKGSAKAIAAFLDCSAGRPVGNNVTYLPYGTRAGMDVTVRSAAGLDSNLAEIRIVHTANNAQAFCTEYLNDKTAACVERTLHEVKVQERVMASCAAGEFTDPLGNRYRFEGKNVDTDKGELGEYRIVDTKTGEPLEFNSASSYDVAFAAFSALCPAALRSEVRKQPSKSSFERVA